MMIGTETRATRARGTLTVKRNPTDMTMSSTVDRMEVSCSERKVFKTDRLRRILLSAAKQSLKGKVPEVMEPVSVKDFIRSCRKTDALKLIAHCMEGERTSVRQALEGYGGSSYVALIGPEGDFSPEEVALAIDCGFVPVHLGESRLRTETAALTMAEAVYFKYL